MQSQIKSSRSTYVRKSPIKPNDNPVSKLALYVDAYSGGCTLYPDLKTRLLIFLSVKVVWTLWTPTQSLCRKTTAAERSSPTLTWRHFNRTDCTGAEEGGYYDLTALKSQKHHWTVCTLVRECMCFVHQQAGYKSCPCLTQNYITTRKLWRILIIFILQLTSSGRVQEGACSGVTDACSWGWHWHSIWWIRWCESDSFFSSVDPER